MGRDDFLKLLKKYPKLYHNYMSVNVDNRYRGFCEIFGINENEIFGINNENINVYRDIWEYIEENEHLHDMWMI